MVRVAESAQRALQQAREPESRLIGNTGLPVHSGPATKPGEGRWQDAKAALRLGITGFRSTPQEQSRLAVGNERSELGLDGDEACGTPRQRC